MPIYEYQCRKCGIIEVSQRITEAPLQRCPECRSKVTKLISQTSFQLKGNGWYATDYASKGGGEAEKSDSTASEGKASTEGAGSKGENSNRESGEATKSGTSGGKGAGKKDSKAKKASASAA